MTAAHGADYDHEHGMAHDRGGMVTTATRITNEETAGTPASAIANAGLRIPDPQRYTFRPGKAFPVIKAKDPKEYLDAALAAERFIATHQVEDGDGIYWKDQCSDKEHISLYSGSTGVVYFYLELYRATGDQRFLNILQRGVRFLQRNWKAATIVDDEHHLFPSSRYDKVNHQAFPGEEYSQNIGPAGVGSVLYLVYRHFPSPDLRATLDDIADWLIGKATRDGKGVRWSGNPGIYLDGGSVLYLAQLYGEFHDERLKAFIDDYGKYLLSTTHRLPDGSVIADGTDQYRAYAMPNHEVGTAGGGYQLTLLYQITGDRKYLEAAEGTTKYLASIAVPQAKGHLIPVRVNHDGTPFNGNADLNDPLGDAGAQHGDLPERYDRPLCYLGDCNGVAGTVRLYYNLWRITGDKAWLAPIDDLTDGLLSVGAPERQSAGLWNAPYYCCGHASILQFFIGAYLAFHEERWLDLARRTADVLLGLATFTGDGDDRQAYWPVAWERIWPNDLTVTVGLYIGAAGIANALLQTYEVLTGTFAVDRLANDPWPDRQ